MYKYVKLNKIAKISTGFPFKGENYSSMGIRVIRGENVTVGSLRWDTIKCWNQKFDQADKYSLKEGDVVIGMDGSKVGKNRARVKTDDLPLLLAQRVALIRNNELSNQNFLYYLIRANSFEEYVERIQTGSSVPHISQKQIEEYPVPLIPVDIQKKISDVLMSLDSKIEINNRINSELEAIAKTLYDYWFVQFDFPNKNGKPYKTSGGKMVWNKELKREIPVGWEVKELRSEIEIQRGISYTSNEINGEGIPMINLNSFNLDGTYKPEGVKTYSGRYTEKNIVESGNLLIAATDVTRNADIIGRAILVPDYYSEKLVFSMDIAKIISKNIPSSFLMMLFNSNHYHDYIKYYATGTLVLHLNLDGVNRYNTELPPVNLLKKFDEFYLPIANRIYMTAKENQKLTELRDWLLPMLMNGQVKVEDLKEELAMVAEGKVNYAKKK
jgi:type I restriction enzyme S subunit